jgi:hypothetical protein
MATSLLEAIANPTIVSPYGQFKEGQALTQKADLTKKVLEQDLALKGAKTSQAAATEASTVAKTEREQKEAASKKIFQMVASASLYSGDPAQQNTFIQMAKEVADTVGDREGSMIAEKLLTVTDPEQKAKLIEQLVSVGVQRGHLEADTTAGKDPRTALIKNYEYAKSQGFEGTIEDFRQADPRMQAELTMLQAQTANLLSQMGMKKEAFETKKIEKKEEKEAAEKQQKIKITHLTSGIDSVLGEIDLAKKEAAESETATGIIGAVSGIVPQTPAYNLKRRLESIKANIGFDKLQAMRDASPTGGALGQVSERELNFLQSTITSLDPNMGDERLLAGLDKVRKHYEAWKDIVNGRVTEEQAKKMLDAEEGGDTTSQNTAPQSALDYLKTNPGAIDQFEAKYGYRPEGF